MLPSFHHPPNADRQKSFQIFEESPEIDKGKDLLPRKRRVGRVKDKYDVKIIGGDLRASGFLASPTNLPKGNSFRTPPPTFGKRPGAHDRVLSPTKLYARSPFQEIGAANTPSPRLVLTPVSTKDPGRRALNGFFSAGKSLRHNALSSKLPLDRSFHGCAKTPSRQHGNKSRDNVFLCKSLFSQQDKTSPIHESSSTVQPSPLQKNNDKSFTLLVPPPVLTAKSSPQLFRVDGGVSPVPEKVSVVNEKVSNNGQQTPARANKALFNNAFIESVSRVGDDTLGLDSFAERRKSCAGDSRGSTNRPSGVLTSSPKCIVKCETPTGSAACSPGNSSSQNNSSGNANGSGNGSGNTSGNGSGNSSGNGSGSGMAYVASGDHLLSVLDTVVDLSPVPHLSSCLDDSLGVSVVNSHNLAGNESSPLFCMSGSDIEHPSVSSASSSVQGSATPGDFSRRRPSHMSASSRDYLDLTANIEESSAVTLLFKSRDSSSFAERALEEVRQIQVIRSETISLKAVQQCDIVVTDLLGSGGFGKVFLGKWFDMDLAIKVMSGKLTTKAAESGVQSGSNWQDCYASEKKILNLKHMNIVRTLAMSLRKKVLSDEPIYIIMEYGGGRNLNQVIEFTADRFSPRRLLRFLKHVVSGLHYIHNNGIIHMDVKPANIIITSQNVPKIGDFGCCISAQKAATASAPDPATSLSLHVPGTPGYTAPELFCGVKASKKCDVYSLAICLWHLWTWELDPYPGMKQPHVLIYCVVKWNRRPAWNQEVVDDNVGNADFFKEYVELTEKNWSRDPKERQTTKGILKFIKRWRKKIQS